MAKKKMPKKMSSAVKMAMKKKKVGAAANKMFGQ